MSSRMNKVNILLRKVVSEIILFELNQPELTRYFFTVTKVKCAPDLQNAEAFISVLGDTDQTQQGFVLLCRNLKRIQRLLGPRLKLKYTPKLFLKLDQSAAYAQKISKRINEVLDHVEPN